MVPPIGRLKRRREFLRVAAGSRRWAAPGLVLQARPRPSDAGDKTAPEAIRVGFTVSRKVGGAVVRNRARRRLRAAAEAVLPAAGQAGCDYVIVGRGGTVSRSFPALLEDLRTAIQRVAKSGETGGKRRRRHRGNGSGRT